MDDGLYFIRDLAVVLLCAALVGALFRRLGLSPVVGYLAAGMIVGPYTPPFSLVTDPERVRTLSQLGLVFLMFFVGLGLSLRRIRQLGVPLLLATAFTALLVFVLTRALAGALGWGATPGLFLAAMLMVSSSAIITKTLSEAGLTHEKFAQRALGITILEDVVAVVMITLLAARVAPDGGSGGAGIVGLGRVLGLLGGFVALLVVVGFLIVPRFLQRLARASDYDLKVASISGMLLGTAFLAAWAGYSVALGAFLLGMVIAETPFRERIERGFGALQAMFSVIFFVSIGMLIDPRQIAAHWALVLGISLFAIAARALCATAAHMVTGRALTGALRTALVVTPIGEFSYIIAQTGVTAKAVPEYFYSLAVGVSAVTAFTAPLLLRGSERLAEWADSRQPALWRGTQEAYRGWLAQLAQRRRRSSLWLLTRGRIVQVGVEGLLLVGILGFSPRLREALPFPLAGEGAPAGVILYWLAVFAIALGLAVALWRNLSAMGMILADAVFSDARTKALVEGAVRFLSAAGLAVLFVLLLPLPVFGLWSAAIAAGAAALFLLLFWRRLVRWHSHFLYSMNDALRAGEGKKLATGKSVDEEEWGVDLVEVVVPEGASYAGQSLSDLGLRSRYGSAVVEVERQGFEIANPRPDLALYPGDKLLLLGDEAAAARTRAFLEQGGGAGKPAPAFSESTLETVTVPDEGSRLGQSLAALRIFNETGVQVLGLRRNGAIALNPGAEEVLRAGDLLLLLANPAELAAFRAWLAR